MNVSCTAVFLHDVPAFKMEDLGTAARSEWWLPSSRKLLWWKLVEALVLEEGLEVLVRKPRDLCRKSELC